MILDLIFPKKCLECGIKGIYICEKCLQKVRLGGLYAGNYSIFKYEGVIRRAIIALKYKYATSVADELVSILVASLLRNNKVASSDYCLVPIPLFWYRKNFRGFNQVELIGKRLAKEMGWEYIPDLLIRTKQTTPQVQLKGVDRRKNLSDVFCVNQCSPSTVHRSLVLFDDVYTTGSTINEAKKVLYNAGFRNVKSLTIAG